MNPDLFLINTDYLTLAKNNQKTLSITIPQTTMGSSDITAEGSVDIPIDTVKGAIPVIWARYIIGSNKGSWVQVGTNWCTFTDYGADYLFWRIRFERTNNTTMRLNWVCVSMNYSHGVTIPAIQLELSITTFYPPNL